MEASFSPEQTDEEVLATVIASYFMPAELEQAQNLARTQSYEAAIAYLIRVGRESLRDSAEPQPPHVYITLPTGTVVIHHPARLAPESPIYTFSVTHLALQAFSPPSSGDTASTERVEERLRVPASVPHATPPDRSASAKRRAKQPARPRPPVFVEQQIRIGTKRQFWTRSGWAIQKGFLGYVLTRLPKGSHRVELVHLPSYHILAVVYLETLDETSHARLQGWVTDAHRLTDWSRGINAILKEKPGAEKKQTWRIQLEELWQARRTEPRQLSFF